MRGEWAACWVRSGIVLALVGLLVGCGKEVAEDKGGKVSREASAGGLHVVVSVPMDELASSEMLKVDVVVRYAEGYKVMLPEIPEKWGGFSVFKTTTHPARLAADGRVVLMRVYTLEPDLPGQEVLPGVVVSARDVRGAEVLLRTKPIGVKVTSVLAPGEAGLRDIAPDEYESAPEQVAHWSWWMLGIGAGCGLAWMVVRLRRKRRACSGDDVPWRELMRLKDAPVEEVMDCLEKAVCRVLLQGESDPVDFTGLGDRFTGVHGFSDAVATYQKLYYAAATPGDELVRALYVQLTNICKEVRS